MSQKLRSSSGAAAAAAAAAAAVAPTSTTQQSSSTTTTTTTTSAPCTHPMQFDGMCTHCGDMVEQSSPAAAASTAAAQSTTTTSESLVKIHHTTPLLTVNMEYATQLHESHTRQLLDDRRLVAVLDLDQTLIQVHAWRVPLPPTPTTQAKLDELGLDVQRLERGDVATFPWNEGGTNDSDDNSDDHHIYAFRLPHDQHIYFLKLRPYLRHFLETLSQHYECHIYTMGSRPYADRLLAILDPDRKLFGDRVLSRDESGSLSKKTLRRLFPVGDGMAVVVDDRWDVWDWSDSVVRVRPYVFFAGTGDINAPPGAADAGTTKAEDSDPASVRSAGMGNSASAPTKWPFRFLERASADRELATLTDVLTQLHTNFYAAATSAALSVDNHPLVSTILNARRQETLGGACIGFSSVFPVQWSEDRLKQSEMWRALEQSGARCVDLNTTHQSSSKHWMDGITHLVCAKADTSKVEQAVYWNREPERRRVWLVTPEWVWASLSAWRRLDESAYLLYPEASSRRDACVGEKELPDPVCDEEEDEETFADLVTSTDPAVTLTDEQWASLEDELADLEENGASSQPASIATPDISDEKRQRRRTQRGTTRAATFDSDDSASDSDASFKPRKRPKHSRRGSPLREDSVGVGESLNDDEIEDLAALMESEFS